MKRQRSVLLILRWIPLSFIFFISPAQDGVHGKSGDAEGVQERLIAIKERGRGRKEAGCKWRQGEKKDAGSRQGARTSGGP